MPDNKGLDSTKNGIFKKRSFANWIMSVLTNEFILIGNLLISLIK